MFRVLKKVQSTQFKMEGELLNAVNYTKNISKKKVTYAKMETFMRMKELFTCKDDLDNITDSFSFPNYQPNQQFPNISIT